MNNLVFSHVKANCWDLKHAVFNDADKRQQTNWVITVIPNWSDNNLFLLATASKPKQF